MLRIVRRELVCRLSTSVACCTWTEENGPRETIVASISVVVCACRTRNPVSTANRSNAEVTPLHEREERSLTRLELTRRSCYSNHHLPRTADVGIPRRTIADLFTVQRLTKRWMFFSLLDQFSLQVNEMRQRIWGSDKPRFGETQAMHVSSLSLRSISFLLVIYKKTICASSSSSTV